jgi:hypothetical protein
MSEEDMDAGRMIARKPKLRERAKKLAEKEKRKVSSILDDALTLYESYTTMKDIVKNDDVAKGMLAYKTILMDAVKLLNDINELYASNYMRLILNLAASATPSMPEMPQQPQAGMQAMTPMAKEMSQMLNTMLVQMMVQMLQSLSTMFGGKQSSAQLPMTLPTPTLQQQNTQVVVE